MIQSIGAFIEYFEGVRRRTLNYIGAIPPDRFEWSPRAGELTCGDLVRHIAAAEQMFVGVAVGGRWKYAGHDRALAENLDAARTYLNAVHGEEMARLRGVRDADLTQSRPALKGQPVKTWRWLMAMVEHEVHHRSQLAAYLTQMGVEPPQIYGLTIEDIVALTTT
jgi:uncharacterized damage-inducible protein DinB